MVQLKCFLNMEMSNSDGTINVSDGVILKKHLAGIKGLNINMANE